MPLVELLHLSTTPVMLEYDCGRAGVGGSCVLSRELLVRQAGVYYGKARVGRGLRQGCVAASVIGR